MTATALQPAIEAICDPAAVRDLFTRAASVRSGLPAWTLLFYALWHRRHIEGAACQGDVFEALAGRR